jgi:hypothetical protein
MTQETPPFAFLSLNNSMPAVHNTVNISDGDAGDHDNKYVLCVAASDIA